MTTARPAWRFESSAASRALPLPPSQFEVVQRQACVAASRRLLVALLTYGARGAGLPNMTAEDCAEKLRGT